MERLAAAGFGGAGRGAGGAGQVTLDTRVARRCPADLLLHEPLRVSIGVDAGTDASVCVRCDRIRFKSTQQNKCTSRPSRS